MTSEIFTFEHSASADVYLRLFNSSGQVFDFNDDTFKALASCTTPYVAATERADMGGTGRSGYQATIDLADVNNTGAANRYSVKAYDNATPADTDNPISDELGITVQFGKLGEREIRVAFEAALTTTAGAAIRHIAWLEHGGEQVDLSAVDASATCDIAVREYGAGSDLYTDNSNTLAAGTDRFETETSSPGFTDDRVYLFTVTITENSIAHTTKHSIPVHG